MLLFFLQILLDPPLGSLPETWEKYKDSINVDKETFKCFDGSKIIKLSQLNDNYLDCNDGSDEPGTAVLSKGKFYCKNEGNNPKIINSWSVNDGICDCCDGSDELLNPHASCSNICGPTKNSFFVGNVTNTKNNQSQIIKNHENIQNELNTQESRPKHAQTIEQDNDIQPISPSTINRIKFKYMKRNISFIEHVLISLWKDYF